MTPTGRDSTRPPPAGSGGVDEATVVRALARHDEEATVVRPPVAAPPRPGSTVQPGPRPRSAAGSGDTTVVAASARPASGDTTRVSAPRPRAGSGDTTVVRPTGPTQAVPRKPPPEAVSHANALALPPGFRLHEYRFDRLLGQGGFGLTYLATDVNLNVKVAIKEYLPEAFAFRTSTRTVSAASSQMRERYQQGLDSFLEEARTLATFRHPHIVRVARFFEAHQTAYMVLDYERGEEFRTWWPRHRNLPERDLVLLLQPLLDGLALVHEAGYLHRDIKPSNIYVREDDGSLVLLDFGSARQSAAHSANGESVLTPGYAPIEQYDEGGQGPWTDIYAFGATLYWLIAGHRPPEAPERLHSDAMVPAKEVGKGRFSETFLAAVDWALRPQPQDRPQNVAQLRQALFAAHASSLGLLEALRADGEDTDARETWRSLLTSPRKLGRRFGRALRTLVEPSAWPMAVKMTLAMVLTALLPMLTTAYYNLQGSREAVSTSELRNLEQLAQSTAGRVAQLIGDSQNLARYLGTERDFVDYLTAPDPTGQQRVLHALDALVQANQDVHLLMLMDRTGTAVVSSDREVMGRNFRFREYFKSAMEGRPYVSGLVVGAVAGAAGMFYAYPVRAADQQVVGAIVLRIKASSFVAILDEVRSDARRAPMLVDGDGVVLHHADPKLLYHSLMPLSARQLQEIKADQRFRRDRIDSLNMPHLAQALVGARSQGNVSYVSSVTRQAEIAGYAPVRNQDGWVVAVSESRQAFEEPIDTLFGHVLASVVLVGLLFLGLALLFSRSIVRPVEALRRAADALKRGDFAHANVSVKGRDELGQLARTFNVMIDVLRQRERARARRRSGERAAGPAPNAVPPASDQPGSAAP